MIKRFCDCCGDEITDRNVINRDLNRVTATVTGCSGRKFTVQVMAALDETWNAGDWCKYCVIDAIKEADDRPRLVQ